METPELARIHKTRVATEGNAEKHRRCVVGNVFRLKTNSIKKTKKTLNLCKLSCVWLFSPRFENHSSNRASSRRAQRGIIASRANTHFVAKIEAFLAHVKDSWQEEGFARKAPGNPSKHIISGDATEGILQTCLKFVKTTRDSEVRMKSHLSRSDAAFHVKT